MITGCRLWRRPMLKRRSCPCYTPPRYAGCYTTCYWLNTSFLVHSTVHSLIHSSPTLTLLAPTPPAAPPHSDRSIGSDDRSDGSETKVLFWAAKWPQIGYFSGPNGPNKGQTQSLGMARNGLLPFQRIQDHFFVWGGDIFGHFWVQYWAFGGFQCGRRFRKNDSFAL